jgi:hypothetical protein
MHTPEGARLLISDKYLPLEMGLKDPSRMVKTEVEAIYKHWMTRQKNNKRPLEFKMDEVKAKIEENRRLRAEALSSMKRAYVDVGSDDEDNGKDTAESSRPKKRPREEGDQLGEKEKEQKQDKGKGKEKKKKNAEKKRKESGGTGQVVPPRPVIKPAERETILRGLSDFAAYQALVNAVLKVAMVRIFWCSRKYFFLLTFNKSDDPGKGSSMKLPMWASWKVDDVSLGPEFYDLSPNNTGYLSTWKSTVVWMQSNPHITNTHAHREACNILLVVGLLLRETKICVDCEPDHPLYNTPFDIMQFEEVKGVIEQMQLPPERSVSFPNEQDGS